jgi:broad specificity phosphatase PhoE
VKESKMRTIKGWDGPSSDEHKMELCVSYLSAMARAPAWTEVPTLIVVSRFLRTQQTAQPTCDRFPSVPVEEWDIEEFTYLEPSRWNGSIYCDRLTSIEAYWKAADPNYCDGPGAESFATLLRRAEVALERLRALIGHPTVFLFSHGQFMQAVKTTVVYPQASDQEKMRLFLRNDLRPAFQNCELLHLRLCDNGTVKEV